ncbi:MAG: DIP1984 family protein [Clostridia bacterium]
MKLAEALLQRADLQKRLMQLRSRLILNAKVQEGEKPAEPPVLLLKELAEMTAQLETLITKINLTNAIALDDGSSMTALLARRDCLRMKAESMRDFLDAASETVMRSTKTEVIVRSTVEVPELRRQTDALSKELRDLDLRIQALNWTTELI